MSDVATVALNPVASKVSLSAGSSMGVALTSCTVPAAGKPTFQLGENEMEMGIGIHGEPGRERERRAVVELRGNGGRIAKGRNDSHTRGRLAGGQRFQNHALVLIARSR